MASNEQTVGTEFPALIGQLYLRWTLDCLIEIAYAISNDFIARPQLYLSDDIPTAILDLRTSYGTSPYFPNGPERQAMISPILGRSDALPPLANGGMSSFYIAREKFINACIAFSERAVDTGVDMLLDRVRSAIVTLRAHFIGLNGRSLRLSAQQIRGVFDAVVSILDAPGIAIVFGVSVADNKWPFYSLDANGAKLIENAGVSLQLPPACKLGYTEFILLQRVAQEGAQAHSLVLNADPDLSDEALKDLIRRGYTWGSSLREYRRP